MPILTSTFRIIRIHFGLFPLGFVQIRGQLFVRDRLTAVMEKVFLLGAYSHEAMAIY